MKLPWQSFTLASFSLLFQSSGYNEDEAGRDFACISLKLNQFNEMYTSKAVPGSGYRFVLGV
jgi:hypothetical protein